MVHKWPLALGHNMGLGSQGTDRQGCDCAANCDPNFVSSEIGVNQVRGLGSLLL